MINQYFQNQTPLTRIFLVCSTYSIISCFLIFHKMFFILALFTATIFIANFLYQRSIALGIICLISISFIFFRIHQKEYYHNLDSNFLEKEVIFKGIIQNIQHTTQDKKTTTLLIKSLYIYNKDAGCTTKPKNILVQLPHQRSKKLQLGQCIKFYRIKLTQPPAENEYRTYLIKEGIWATAYVSSENFYILKKSYITWYQKYFLQLSNYFQTMTSHLYNPLFLGKKEKDKVSLEIQHQSMYWGIAHHMARSGIHLVTILGLFVAIFHYIGLFHRFRFLMYAILILFYAYISVSSVSFIRSLLMILFQMFTKFHGFMYSGIHAFLLTTLIIVHHNPFNVLFLDFQLSFGITAVIIWLFYIKWHKIIAF
jgi:predicted membrane metal-binding protein